MTINKLCISINCEMIKFFQVYHIVLNIHMHLRLHNVFELFEVALNANLKFAQFYLILF